MSRFCPLLRLLRYLFLLLFFGVFTLDIFWPDGVLGLCFLFFIICSSLVILDEFYCLLNGIIWNPVFCLVFLLFDCFVSILHLQMMFSCICFFDRIAVLVIGFFFFFFCQYFLIIKIWFYSFNWILICSHCLWFCCIAECGNFLLVCIWSVCGLILYSLRLFMVLWNLLPLLSLVQLLETWLIS